MNRVNRLLSHAAILAIVAVMLLASACSSGVKSEAAVRSMEKHFDLTVQTYKKGQFMLDGAVLSPMDLGGHFAYLRDQHRLPKSVFLERSDDSKIRKDHLLSMARLELDYGFSVYYERGGKLVRIEVTNKKDIPNLHDNTKSAPLPDENAGKSARGTDHFPSGG